MDVFIEKQDRHHRLSFRGSGDRLLALFDINPETVILVKDGQLITSDTMLKDTDAVRILSVISGG
ncbi:MAG: hypothetical protein GXP63_04310 [DPANN group archaeon]|nr:hypothetical protein [DPANN group archaeon]